VIIGRKADTIGIRDTNDPAVQMDDLAAIFINEEFTRRKVTPAKLDRLLAEGWRHFGPQFFRYNLAIYGDEIRLVVPLRIRLSDFRISKSQTRVLRKNSDTQIRTGPVHVTAEIDRLFHRHKARFRQHPPESIYTFLSPDPADEPCEMRQLSIYRDDRLIAASFFDVGARSLSGIYAVFDPEESGRGLGIYTMLKEIELAASEGKEFYYQGYCYSGSSFYDYKKRFHGTEAFQWNGVWAPLPR
jgi:arginine-tRNA-protein transferase